MAAAKPSTFKAVIGRALRETGAALRERGNAEIYTRHRPVLRFEGETPFQTNDTFWAPNASVIGNVTAWDQSSVWYKAVVRADSPHSSITIGFNSSIGEGTVVMTELPSVTTLPETGFPPDTHVGHYVTVGAGCVLKSCRIDDLVLIGDKCTILTGALVEHHAILEPGTVVQPYQRIPAGQKWGGNPARYVAQVTPEEKETIQPSAEHIHLQAKEHLLEFLPVGYSYVHLEDLEKNAAEKPIAG